MKLLNPYIMQRENVMENYRTAEKLEGMLEKTDISILSALWFDGRKMQCIEGQFFYLYEWYGGKALKAEEIFVCGLLHQGTSFLSFIALSSIVLPVHKYDTLYHLERGLTKNIIILR